MDLKPEREVRRVLMTGDTVGGVWTFTLELAAALAARDIEVVLATFGGAPSKDQVADASNIPNLCLLASDFKLEWMEDPWDDVEESGRWLMELEREYSPEVIHLNSFGHGALPWRSPTVLTAHSCVLSWWQAVKKDPAPVEWRKYQVETARSLQSVRLITAPSAAMAASLALHYGADRSSVRVIANGRNAAGFYWGEKQPLILSAGRVWDEAKNIRMLAGIAGELFWPVYLAGDAGSSQMENCRMLGRLPAAELASWYARAAIYVLPAKYEPFGLSVLEAALSKCALVLGDIPSLREIWGEAAYFISPDDPAGLHRVLQNLMGDPDLRAAAAERAYARAMTFKASRMSEEYLDAYRDAVAGRKVQCVS